MTVAARRFRLDIAGTTLVGLAFASDAELEAWLAARGALVVEGLTSRAAARAPGPTARARREAPAAALRGPGRPPIDDVDAIAEIGGLVEQGLDPAAATRTVAQTLDGDLDTTEHRLRRKLRTKSRTKIGTKL